jgi:phosphate transport system substrate-binding protein
MAMAVNRRLAIRALLLSLVLGMAAAFPAAPAARQAGPDIAVIVHPDVPVDNLTLADLRRILLGDREFWTSGSRVTLYIRAPIARERDAMVKDVCQMTEAQFRQHWIAKVFRADTATGPKIVYSAQMALEQVGRTPGALAFVEAPLAGKGVKVLRIDGRLPGQQGYRLR